TIVLDMNPRRLAFVREVMGVPDTVEVAGDGAELARVAELTGGDFAEVVVDATGSNRSMSRALDYGSFAGRLVYVGITQAELGFPHAPVLHRRELTLLASRNALAGDFRRIIQLIEEGRIDTRPWITHRAGLGEVADRFAGWLDPEAGVIKAMVAVEG
ncbi:MAG: zinc-binding dehydrogenase, partial [Verrucomicrobiota bacterium]